MKITHLISQKSKNLSRLLCIAAFSSCSMISYAQQQQVNLSGNNLSLKMVFQQIEKQTHLFIDYKASDLNDEQIVRKMPKSVTVEQALKELLAGTNCEVIFSNGHIVIKRLPTDDNKVRLVEGLVTDSSGEPVIGANIKEKGTTNGTITDFDGKFHLEISNKSLLEVSYIGYKPQLIQAKGTNLNIILKEDTELLEEVVVVGYGSQKKVNLTGSVASVNADELKDRVQPNVLSAVQGTVPGVTVISRPGQTPSINFRGRGNLGTSSPLYVIDGAITDASFFSNLDPNSIESISFLKDAASSSIYGSRAAYGVVLVTTKQGKKEKLNVSYNGYVGVKTPTYLPEILDSWDYATLLNEAKYNVNPGGGKNQAYTTDEIEMFRNGSNPDKYPNTNWFDEVLDKSAITTQHSVNFSGGSDKVRFFTGLGYLYNDDFMPGVSNDRYNLNTSIQGDITEWLTVKAGVKYIRNASETKNGTPWMGNFLLVPSIMVARQSNGEWGSIAGGRDATQDFMNNNPLRALSKRDWSKSTTENSMYNLGFDLKPFADFVLSGQMDYKRNEYKYKSYSAEFLGIKHFETGKEIPGTANKNPNSMQQHWNSSSTLMTTLTAKYDLDFNAHKIGFLLGTSYEHYKFERLYQKRTDFISDGLQDIEQGNTISKEVPGGAAMLESKMLSYFGRVNYSFKDRYLFEANVRADASSRFHKDNRWGWFPSFSAGWRISEEAFMKPIHWIDNLKLRASYGTLGNINNVGYYDYFQLLSGSGNYNFNNTPVKGVLESQIANRKLGWETVSLTDIGIDADLFGGKLNLTADYYIKNTSDILLGYNVPKETGIWTSPVMNLAKVRNKGFEFSVTHHNTIGQVTYSIGANIATNNNEITNLSGSDNMIQNGGDNIRYILKEGEAIGSYYGLKTDGVYTQAEIDAGKYYLYGREPKAGDLKYIPQRSDIKYVKDLAEGENRGNASINDNDRTIIGKDVPDFTYGLNLSVQWKGLELSLFGQGVSGTSVAFESEQVFAFMLNSNPRKYHLARWTEDNPNPKAKVPRLYGGTSLDEYNKHFSDNQLFDADYFRIKTINLGYMFPKTITSKIGLSSLKVFVTGENLLTFRADKVMKDFDPESATGRGLGALGTKSIAFGLNVSF